MIKYTVYILRAYLANIPAEKNFIYKLIKYGIIDKLNDFITKFNDESLTVYNLNFSTKSIGLF
jgi:hypothetical protein